MSPGKRSILTVGSIALVAAAVTVAISVRSDPVRKAPRAKSKDFLPRIPGAFWISASPPNRHGAVTVRNFWFVPGSKAVESLSAIVSQAAPKGLRVCADSVAQLCRAVKEGPWIVAEFTTGFIKPDECILSGKMRQIASRGGVLLIRLRGGSSRYSWTYEGLSEEKCAKIADRLGKVVVRSGDTASLPLGEVIVSEEKPGLPVEQNGWRFQGCRMDRRKAAVWHLYAPGIGLVSRYLSPEFYEEFSGERYNSWRNRDFLDSARVDQTVCYYFPGAEPVLWSDERVVRLDATWRLIIK